MRVVEFPHDLSVRRHLERPTLIRFAHERVAVREPLGRAARAREEGLLGRSRVLPDDLPRRWIELEHAGLPPSRAAVVEDQDAPAGDEFGVVLAAESPLERPDHLAPFEIDHRDRVRDQQRQQRVAAPERREPVREAAVEERECVGVEEVPKTDLRRIQDVRVRGAAQRIEDRDPTLLPPVGAELCDEVEQHGVSGIDLGHDSRLACEDVDVAVRGDLEVVVRLNRAGPEQARVAVDFDEAQALVDREHVAVREEVRAPEEPGARVQPRPGKVGPDVLELAAPPMQDAPFHVDQHGLGCMARAVEVRARPGARAIVPRDAAAGGGGRAAGEIADRLEARDLVALLGAEPRVRARGAELAPAPGHGFRRRRLAMCRLGQRRRAGARPAGRGPIGLGAVVGTGDEDGGQRGGAASERCRCATPRQGHEHFAPSRLPLSRRAA